MRSAAERLIDLRVLMIAQTELLGGADATRGIERLAPRRPRSRSRRRRLTSAAGASAPLSVDLAGDASLDRGPGTVRQHDQTVELFARHLVSVPAFLRRC